MHAARSRRRELAIIASRIRWIGFGDSMPATAGFGSCRGIRSLAGEPRIRCGVVQGLETGGVFDADSATASASGCPCLSVDPSGIGMVRPDSSRVSVLLNRRSGRPALIIHSKRGESVAATWPCRDGPTARIWLWFANSDDRKRKDLTRLCSSGGTGRRLENHGQVVPSTQS